MEYLEPEYSLREAGEMRKIDKQEEPEWFERWKNEFYMANGRKAHYKNDFSTNDAEVEKVFKYSFNGEIHSVKGRTTSDAAEQMIKKMGLDSFHLERERRKAIEESEVFDDTDYTEDDIRGFIEFYSQKNNGKYIPYCKAIIDCLMSMI